MADLIVPSYAKINLGLSIVGKRADGYHELVTLFQELQFHDTLSFSTDATALTLTSNQPELSVGADNLICRAVQALAQRTGCPTAVNIHLDKQIPLGAGLGGGSSNAAATLRGLNRLFDLRVAASDLHAIAADLGSDVPFFLFGGTALATGRGEQIQPLPDLPPRWVMLIYPGIHIASAWAYKNLKFQLTNFEAFHYEIPQYNASEITGLQYGALQNMLTAPVIEKYPIIQTITSELRAHGAEGALMSGSGSTVFGIFQEQAAAEHTLQQMERGGWLTVLTSFKQRDGCKHSN